MKKHRYFIAGITFIDLLLGLLYTIYVSYKAYKKEDFKGLFWYIITYIIITFVALGIVFALSNNVYNEIIGTIIRVGYGTIFLTLGIYETIKEYCSK